MNPKSIIPSDFASVYERSFDDECFNTRRYLRHRDNFFAFARDSLHLNKTTPEDIFAKFERKPKLKNDIVLCYAAGCAEYYCRILGFNKVPEWCKEVPVLPQELIPVFPLPIILSDDLQRVIDATPKELLKRGFIYEEHNFTIY